MNEEHARVPLGLRPDVEYRRSSGKVANCTVEPQHCRRSPAASSLPPVAAQIALYHFATKSLEDFANKMARGSSMSKRMHKGLRYFADIARCAASLRLL